MGKSELKRVFDYLKVVRWLSHGTGYRLYIGYQCPSSISAQCQVSFWRCTSDGLRQSGRKPAYALTNSFKQPVQFLLSGPPTSEIMPLILLNC